MTIQQRASKVLQEIDADQTIPAVAKQMFKTAIERLLVISRYDADSRFGTGICQFGCDTPNIAQTTLAIICDQWNQNDPH